jgi:hypothetical protein
VRVCRSLWFSAFFSHSCPVLLCRHPNIVRVYGYCLTPPTVCIIMELLPTSLADKLYGGNAGGKEPADMPSSSWPASDADGGGPVSYDYSSVIGPPVAYGIGGLAGARGGARAPPVQQLPPLLPPLEVLTLAQGITAGLVHLHSTPEHRQVRTTCRLACITRPQCCNGCGSRPCRLGQVLVNCRAQQQAGHQGWFAWHFEPSNEIGVGNAAKHGLL